MALITVERSAGGLAGRPGEPPGDLRGGDGRRAVTMRLNRRLVWVHQPVGMPRGMALCATVVGMNVVGRSLTYSR